MNKEGKSLAEEGIEVEQGNHQPQIAKSVTDFCCFNIKFCSLGTWGYDMLRKHQSSRIISVALPLRVVPLLVCVSDISILTDTTFHQ